MQTSRFVGSHNHKVLAFPGYNLARTEFEAPHRHQKAPS
jgi:hypothetical protein